MESILEMFESNWRDPFTADGTDLCNVSTGAEPPQEVMLDLLNAHNSKGEKTYETFVKDRLAATKSDPFFSRIPRLNLKSFSNMYRKTVAVNGKKVMLKIDRNLFGKMAVIAQTDN